MATSKRNKSNTQAKSTTTNNKVDENKTDVEVEKNEQVADTKPTETKEVESSEQTEQVEDKTAPVSDEPNEETKEALQEAQEREIEDNELLDSDQIQSAVAGQELPLVESTEGKLDPVKDGNYLGLPQALRDAEASQEQIHTPTGTRRTPPMNPFMKIQQERESKAVKSNVPTAADMAEKIEKKIKVDVTHHYVLGSIVAKLNNYVANMAPNTPVGETMGANWQVELSKCFFEALAASPDASMVALRIIEMYFEEYRAHAFARSHVFRFMDVIRLEQQRLTAFQSLLHLFIELGNKDGRSKKEIQREINIGKIADAISDNTDAQVRLVEFLN